MTDIWTLQARTFLRDYSFDRKFIMLRLRRPKDAILTKKVHHEILGDLKTVRQDAYWRAPYSIRRVFQKTVTLHETTPIALHTLDRGSH